VQHRPDTALFRLEYQFGKPVAQFSVRTPYVYHPDGAKENLIRRDLGLL